MTPSDALGYLASGLVLAAFCMKEIVPLRMVALCSNLAFLAYGVSMGLMPIWLLHGLLLLMNGWRLALALLQSPPASTASLALVEVSRSGRRGHSAERTTNPASSSA
jgi:hypothetical protein